MTQIISGMLGIVGKVGMINYVWRSVHHKQKVVIRPYPLVYANNEESSKHLLERCFLLK